MQLCLKVLTKPDGLKELNQVQKILVDEGKAIFAKFLELNSKSLQFAGKHNKEEFFVT